MNQRNEIRRLVFGRLQQDQRTGRWGIYDQSLGQYWDLYPGQRVNLGTCSGLVIYGYPEEDGSWKLGVSDLAQLIPIDGQCYGSAYFDDNIE